jgi:two-component system, sensor histidine kinase and response regulator
MKKIYGVIVSTFFLPFFLAAQTEKVQHNIDSLTAVLDEHPNAALIEEYVRLANKAIYVTPGRAKEMEEVISKAGQRAGYVFAPNRVSMLQIIYYTNLSRFDSANVLLEHLKKRTLKQNDELGLLHYYLNKGIVAKRSGKFGLAAQMYYNGLSIADRLGDQRHKIALYNNLTALYNALLQYDKAKQMIWQAIKIAESTGAETSVGVGGIYANLAILYKRTDQLDSALHFYKKAIAEFEKEESTLLGGAYCNIGILYGTLNLFDSAEFYLQRALALNRQFRQPAYEINTMNALAEMRVAQRQYEEAIVYADAARKLAHNNDVLQAELNALQLLHMAYAGKGDYRQAYQLHTEAAVVNDSLFNVERQTIIDEVKEKYESDKKDEQIVRAGEELNEHKMRTYYLTAGIALIAILAVFILRLYYKTGRLNRKIAAQARAIEAKNTDLARVNQVKDKLFAVISHDLRAPISSLHGLITLMDTSQVSADKMEAMKVHLQSQLQQTTGLMETLLNWAKTQMRGWEIKKEPVKLARVVANIQNQFAKMAEEKGLMLRLKADDKISVMADEQLLHIVLYNLVSNAIKYTGAHGKVWLDVVKEEDDYIQVCVCDEGKGIDEDELSGLLKSTDYYTTPGTANERGFGFGLKICMELARQMNAIITAQSQKGKGSRFAVRLPIS